MLLFRPRRAAAHPARRTEPTLSDCRPRADAGDRSRCRVRRRGHRPRRRRAAAHGGGGGLRRAAAHRRRHASEDFEAMAMGKPVVSTTIGAEGLPVTAGVDVARGRLAGRVCPGRRTPVPEPGRAPRVGRGRRGAWSRSSYDWSAVFGHLEQALEAAAAGRTRHPLATATAYAGRHRTPDKELACASRYSAWGTSAASRRRRLPPTATRWSASTSTRARWRA